LKTGLSWRRLAFEAGGALASIVFEPSRAASPDAASISTAAAEGVRVDLGALPLTAPAAFPAFLANADLAWTAAFATGADEAAPSEPADAFALRFLAETTGAEVDDDGGDAVSFIALLALAAAEFGFFVFMGETPANSVVGAGAVAFGGTSFPARPNPIFVATFRLNAE